MPKTSPIIPDPASVEAFDVIALRRQNEALKKESSTIKSAFGPEPKVAVELAVRHAQLLKENEQLRKDQEKLKAQIETFRRMALGRKSERHVELSSQDFDQACLYSDEEMKKLRAGLGGVAAGSEAPELKPKP